MNFSPFGVGVPLSAAMPVTTQFTTGKLAQNVTAANGQVVGVLQGGENGVHYIRPLETSAFAQAASPTPNQGQTQTLITLPITMPGAKPGDPQQTVQIQVVNSAPITTMTPTTSANSPKYQISQIPIQTFGQGATVLTVAYNSNQEGIQIVDGQNGIPEGMTVVAALQPQDIQMLQQQQHQQQQPQLEAAPTNNAAGDKDPKDITISPVSIIKTENPGDKSDYIQTSTVQEYLQRIQTHTLPLSLQQFLKFNTDVKRENIISEDGVMEGVVESQEGVEQDHEQHLIMNEYAEPGMETEEVVDDPEKTKKKKKYKKKPPKPKTPKPGQVHIATALDGTMLFCCPECHMAYPEKELLEQHLVGHKIERRFICGICGAGLKRKEHLERHKLGHNPERPFVCSVCSKGFKRKEHLNLHFVIHSGEKTEICGECGKGFYRKDHLRKHTRSHMTRRVKEQAQGSVIGKDGTAQVTIQVPTSQTPIQIPVQIQVPQHHIQVTTNTDEDGQVSTVVLPTASEGITIIPN